MPKSSKSPAPENGGVQEMPFEAALKRLEAIVEAMESEDLPLESLLARFEEGTRLAHVCQTKLAEAEVKLQQLEQNAAGDLMLKPLSAENRAEAGSNS